MYATLDNEFFWVRFLSNGMSSALEHALNTQLSLLTNNASRTIDLLEPSAGYAASDVVGVHPAYACFIMYQELARLEGGVYCWVDLDRRWALAYTQQRQERCRDRYVRNGAMYMETILRNMDFNAWSATTQGSFQQRIGDGVAESPDGPAFLTYLATHQMLQVEREVQFWSDAGLDSFVLQYTNLNQLGLEESIDVTNALGATSSLRIKSIAQKNRATVWFTLSMTLTLMYGFGALSHNESLVRNASTFFGHTTPNAIEVYNVGTPLNRFQQAVHDQLGPLCNTDLLWVPVPAEVLRTVQTFRSSVLAALAFSPAFATAYDALTSMTLHPTPRQWRDPSLTFFGGNPTCLSSAGYSFVHESYGFDDGCMAPMPLTLCWSPLASLFALSIATATEAPITLCDLLPETESTPQGDGWHQPDSSGNPIFQMVQRNASLGIETQRLLDPSYAFFGWMSIYEWAMNTREVILFDGDAHSYAVMTYAYASLPSPTYSVLSCVGVFLWFGSVVVSGVALALGVFVLWLRVTRPPSSSSTPWFYFHRLTSASWLNRGLVAGRGVAALLCLSSGTLQHQVTPSRGTLFVAGTRSVVVSGILAGDVTWVLYVLQDFLLPLTPRSNGTMASTCALLAWLSLFVVDVAAPIKVSTHLHRACLSENLDAMLHCVSGHLSIALLGPSETTTNDIAAAMNGVLCVSFGSRKVVFDTKLWMPLHRICIDKGAPSRYELSTLPRLRVPKTILLLCGILYTAIGLASNVAFLAVAQTFLANDFGWTGFNSTGMHAFLANAINQQLLISTNMTLDLSSPALADISQLYNDSMASIAWSAHAARRQLLDTSVPLARFAQGLRDMNPCMLPWMFTQYCWLDLDRHWAMASTTKRQARCVASQMANGAVYLEIPLRNVRDWAAWDRCWGVSFEIGFVLHLQTSQRGQQWLSNLKLNVNSVDDEVALWRLYSITRFQLQWQNYKTIGMVDTFWVTSALGYTSSLTLSWSEGDYHTWMQTSHRMYWAFARDLWAIATNATYIGGKSLLSSSPEFAFANSSSTLLLAQNLTLPTPLRPGLVLLASTLGPFGAIDIHLVAAPRLLVDLLNTVLNVIATQLVSNELAQAHFLSLPSKPSVCEVLPFLLSDPSIMLVGGNLMCGDDLPPEPSIGLYSGFGAFSVCNANFFELMQLSTKEQLFAFAAFLTTTVVEPADYEGICALDLCSGAACGAQFRDVVTWLETFSIPVPQGLVPSVVQSVRELQIETTQYFYFTNDTSHVQLYHVPLLAPSERLWGFYGWCFLYEWATGAREAVQFTGDAGTITSLSQWTPLLTMSPDPGEVPVSFASFCQGCILYVTTLLIAVAGLETIYSLGQRGRIEAWNLFELSRIVGHVWAGRLVLLLRSLTAIWILNTAPLLLTKVGAATLITSPSLTWYKTILAASEVSWLVYALNDLFSVVTRQYTATYAPKSAFLTWFLAILWSFASPVPARAQLQRDCSYVDMDSGLLCSSAGICIGSTSGSIAVVVMTMWCILLTYLVDRLRFPRLPPVQVHSLLLNAQSLYLFDLADWAVDGEYFLDKASALMAGILSIEYKDNLYIFDIKTWRYMTLPVPVVPHALDPSTVARLQSALPLGRI
ncbi:hypothetical protein SDRG_17103 [Saprolegnia diclina VS20]|uniref:Uncharacterized protein n=1 Tax=Saprolegnia diclina (strain VS20) TaxID=1156394 RepID=T0PS19_SAPDV|nr:hypothetical protein SDRG_17103 [Saprolegnia diclina VS20]EQC25011.1 hypothetical protein SDRG_17103 [Saprolegnia diclina VS20]|eukprot:XP_008621560.1 hypothetical protein SDRG_17103 [Saprolegnia diclina VS20]